MSGMGTPDNPPAPEINTELPEADLLDLSSADGWFREAMEIRRSRVDRYYALESPSRSSERPCRDSPNAPNADYKFEPLTQKDYSLQDALYPPFHVENWVNRTTVSSAPHCRVKREAWKGGRGSSRMRAKAAARFLRNGSSNAPRVQTPFADSSTMARVDALVQYGPGDDHPAGSPRWPWT